MTKKLLFISLLLIVSFSAFAQVDPFMPPNPTTFAQGGAFTANAEGLNAFFYNPAGFRSEGELTLTSVSTWAFMDTSILNFVLSQLGVTSGEVASETGFGAKFDAVIADFEDIGAWLDALNTEDPTYLEAAIEAGATEAGINIDDASTLTQEEAVAIVLSSDKLTQDGGLADILNAMDAAAQGAGATTTMAGEGVDSATVQSNFDAVLEEGLIPGGNVRLGGMVSLGYVGNGFGIGLFAMTDTSFNGATLLSARGRMINSLTLAGGFSFDIGGLTLGVAFRPTLIGYADVNPGSVMLDVLGASGGSFDMGQIFSEGIYNGFRLGVDVGALLDLGPFTLGATVKDIIPWAASYGYYSTFEEYAQDVLQLNFQGGSELTAAQLESVYNPQWFKVNLGIQFHPDFGIISDIIDLRLNADIHDFFGFFRYINFDPNDLDADKATLGDGYNILKYIHLGAEVALFGGLATARAGFFGDYITAGLGFHLLFLDINAAVGVSDLRERNGALQFNQLGFSLEAAIRF